MFEDNLIVPVHSEETGKHPEQKRKQENNLIIRSLSDPRSRKKAIHAQCFLCIGGTEKYLPDPGWRREIRDCRGQGCYLKPFRPFQDKRSPTEN